MGMAEMRVCASGTHTTFCDPTIVVLPQECGVGSRVLINYSDKAVVLYGGVVIDVRKAPPGPPDVTPQRRRVRGPPVLAAHLQARGLVVAVIISCHHLADVD